MRSALDFDPRLGEAEATVAGVTYRRGDSLVLRPAPGRDPLDGLLAGRSATLERIYVGLDEQVYLAVTLDGDPAQELMRDTGRYYFFFSDEVELIR